MTLKETLQRAIKTSKLSMYAISKQSGVSYGQLHRFMSGKRSISLETADTLMTFLNITTQGKK